jgi:probable F420-dependent oxidoreductase
VNNDPSRHWSTVSANLPASVITAQAQQLEAAGLAGVFAPQVYGPPWIPLAACAAVTNRLQLASGIALAFARSPFETAMAAMDLDRLSGGRFILGLGPSVRAWSEGIFGMPYGKPVEHLRETIELIRLVIEKSHTGELKRFEGKYHQHDFTEFQPMAQPVRTRIPIWIAAVRPALIRLAAQTADGLMGHPIWSTSWATNQAADALKEGLSAAGRKRSDIHFNAWFWTLISDDPDDAVNDAKGTVAFYAGVSQYEDYFAAHGFRDEARRCQQAVQRGDYLSAASAVPDEMARTFVICGTQDEVRKRLEPVWDIADSVCLVPPIGGVPPAKLISYVTAISQTFYA